MNKKQSLKSYAGTQVTASRTRDQIEQLLQQVGAIGFRWASNLVDGQETLEAGIRWQERDVAFRLQVRFEDEQERKQKMRALYWYMKTKIEAIQFGLVDLEEEFLPYLITESGDTVMERLVGDGGLKMLPEGKEP